MCGRYTLTTSAEGLAVEFDLAEVPRDLEPRYNIAPGGPVAAILNRDGERRLEMVQWGLIPSWAKDPTIGRRLINARAETAAQKPSFRAALRRRRCLIPADGFYEWMGVKAARTPMYIRMKSAAPFAFAGLWESWRGADAAPTLSCAILTTEPNELMARIHNRMPVILPREAYATWLDPSLRDPADLTALMQPLPDGAMEACEVSRLVNQPTNDRPECIAAIGNRFEE